MRFCCIKYERMKYMMKNRVRENRAITLIALVVTVIVLLVLAGVSISMLVGQNGVLTRAAEAKIKTDEAEKQENERMQDYEDTISLYAPEKLPETEDTKPYYPSSDFFKKEGDLSTGLVIQDKEGNQYVWVEVPKTLYDDESYNTETTNGDKKPNPGEEYNENDYNNIEYCLKKYTADYSNSGYKDIYAEDTTISNGWFTGEDEYNIAKQKMLKSVYENGGFWVGRYEAGIENENDVKTYNNEGTATVPSLTPVTKRNAYPYNYVTRTQAKVLAERVGGENYTSSLMFGIQWDLMLKFIEEKEVENAKDTEKEATRTNIKNALRSTSKYNNKYIGNYINADLILNRGKFGLYGVLSTWYKFDSIDKTNLVTGSKKLSQSSIENAILLTTGASDDTKLQNIYDISGNAWEWTLEFYDARHSCVFRGGGYINIASDVPAMSYGKNTTIYPRTHVGFRVGLWK